MIAYLKARKWGARLLAAVVLLLYPILSLWVIARHCIEEGLLRDIKDDFRDGVRILRSGIWP